MLKTFDSVPEFVRAVQNSNCHFKWADSWVNNQTGEQACENALHGTVSLVEQAESYLSRLNIPEIETFRGRWRPNVQGPFTCVPDYLSGSPTSMRTWRKTPADVNPIRFYVSTTCSAGINSGTMLNRGCAILALLQILERVRPVEIYLLVELGSRLDSSNDRILTIRLDTQPLDLAIAGYCLADVGFSRQLTYNYVEAIGGGGNWPSEYYAHREDNYPCDPKSPYALWLRELIGMSEQDVYVKPAHLGQAIIRDPLIWIQATIGALC